DGPRGARRGGLFCNFHLAQIRAASHFGRASASAPIPAPFPQALRSTVDAPTKTPTPAASAGAIKLTPTTADQIAADVARMGPREAAHLLSDMSDAEALDILQRVNPAFVADILPEMSEGRRAKLFLAGPASVTQQWTLNQTFPQNTVGRLMEPPTAIFKPTDTVASASTRVKELVKKIFVTYCFVCDDELRLVGIV